MGDTSASDEGWRVLCLGYIVCQAELMLTNTSENDVCEPAGVIKGILFGGPFGVQTRESFVVALDFLVSVCACMCVFVCVCTSLQVWGSEV